MKMQFQTEKDFGKFSGELFYFRNIQVPSKWKPEELKFHLENVFRLNFPEESGFEKENIPANKNEIEINLWKLNNYIYLDNFKTSLHSFSISLEENKTYQIEAKLLNTEFLNSFALDEILKNSYYLVAEVRHPAFELVEKELSKEEKREITGYCESCNKEALLSFTCLCDEV